MTPAVAHDTQIRQLMRRLSRVETDEAPFLTIYLDVRPEIHGERPKVREGLVILRDRLRDISKTLPIRGAARESFDADRQLINEFVGTEMRRSTEGLAIFACSRSGVFETIEVDVPFRHQVSAGRIADLYQLARVLEDYETALVAVIDTNTARLYVYQKGELIPEGGPDDDPVSYHRSKQGGLSQLQYQRHIDKHRKQFAGQTARALKQIVETENIRHVIIAGAEPAVTALMQELPQDIAERVERVTHIMLDANKNEIEAEIEPILREAEARSEESAVERVVGEVKRHGLGVAGVDAVRLALLLAQVDLLLIDDRAQIDTETRAELVRGAEATDAGVEVVEGNERLLQIGGVAALLRYRFKIRL